MTEIIIDAEEMVEKLVKRSGSSGQIYVPRSWVGRRVKVVLQPEKKKA